MSNFLSDPEMKPWSEFKLRKNAVTAIARRKCTSYMWVELTPALALFVSHKCLDRDLLKQESIHSCW